MVSEKNPVVAGLNNWVGIKTSSIVTDQGTAIVIPSIVDNADSWLHIHTSTSRRASFSQNDISTMNYKRSHVAAYKNVNYWVGQVKYSQTSPGLETGIEYYFSNGKGAIQLNENSYKNAKK